MIYDYKSDELVQDTILECFCPLVEDIADEISTLRRYNELSIYAPSYIAKEILARMLDEIDEVWVHSDSHNDLLYKDDNKVIITLSNDGAIFVENAYDEDGVIKRTEAVLSYVYDGFTNKEVEDIAVNVFSVLVFGFEEEEIEDDDTLVEYSDDKDGDTHGFTASRSDENGYYSYSFYSTNSDLVSKEIKYLEELWNVCLQK